MPATPPLPDDLQESARLANGIGYPVMLKASWGGGGRGMRVVESDRQLAEVLPVARREAKAAFGNDEVYLEKLVRRARHIEVQILGDSHGELVHLFERDCTVQRRNQKVVERAPAVFLTEAQRTSYCECGARDRPCVAVSSTPAPSSSCRMPTPASSTSSRSIRASRSSTPSPKCATGIDIVKAQIRIAGGARIGTPESGVPAQADIRINGHAMQCRVTTEDPENNFIPDYGKITAYRSPAGFGIRLDARHRLCGARSSRASTTPCW